MSDLSTFLQGIAAHWVALMSGVASVVIGLWENSRSKLKAKAFWAIAVVCLFFAFYQAWHDQYKNALSAKAELQEKYQPRFVAEIQQFGLTRFPGIADSSQSMVVLGVEIRNIGAPSIAEHFALSAILPDGARKLFNLVGKFEGVTITNPDGTKTEISKYDRLDEKAISAPLPTNGQLTGWLVYHWAGQNVPNGTQMTLAFSDAIGGVYQVKRTLGTGMSDLGGLEHMPGLQH